jgi:hypothetical protein
MGWAVNATPRPLYPGKESRYPLYSRLCGPHGAENDAPHRDSTPQLFIYIYKAIPLQAWTGPEGSRRLRLPDCKTIGTWNWYGCQPYAPAAFTSQEIFLVLVRGWVKRRATVRPEEICQWKIPVTLSGFELTTFPLLAHCLNQLSHRVAHLYMYGR